MLRHRLAVALAFACIAAAPPPAPERAAFAGIPDVRFIDRPIGGASVEALAAALEASADRPAGGGSSFGHTRWSIDWHWRGAGRGRACRVRSVTLRFAAIVTLPRLVESAPLDPATRARWDRFAAALAEHEAGHARLAYDRLPAVRSAIAASRCDDAAAAGGAALAALDRDQAAYDRATRNGATQGAHFP